MAERLSSAPHLTQAPTPRTGLTSAISKPRAGVNAAALLAAGLAVGAAFLPNEANAQWNNSPHSGPACSQMYPNVSMGPSPSNILAPREVTEGAKVLFQQGTVIQLTIPNETDPSTGKGKVTKFYVEANPELRTAIQGKEVALVSTDGYGVLKLVGSCGIGGKENWNLRYGEVGFSYRAQLIDVKTGAVYGEIFVTKANNTPVAPAPVQAQPAPARPKPATRLTTCTVSGNTGLTESPISGSSRVNYSGTVNVTCESHTQQKPNLPTDIKIAGCKSTEYDRNRDENKALPNNRGYKRDLEYNINAESCYKTGTYKVILTQPQ